jgi:pilus assembly protein CpaC
VIIVTPFIVRPISESSAVRVPTDLVGPPSDLDRLLFGKLGTTKTGKSSPPTGSGVHLHGDAGFMYE